MTVALAAAALALLPPVAADGATPVRVEGNRRINLACAGTGRPTVILTAGAGASASSWRVVQAVLAARTRTCAWDRAGFGRSDASTARQTAVETTRDLTRALAAAKVAGPLVLVAHSIGAWETLLFADRQRARVAGMVLVDPSPPDMFRRFGEDPARLMARFAAPYRACIAPPRASAASPAVSCPAGTTRARAETAISFFDAAGESARAAANPGRDYGAMPLLVLTAGARPPAPTPWSASHDAMAAFSRRGVNRHVADSGHMMHRERPQAIVAAVVEVLDQVRRR